jgi:hypothetical protein
MALDLSVRSREQTAFPPTSLAELKHCRRKAATAQAGGDSAAGSDENEDTNNNTVTAVNLSKPKSPPDLMVTSVAEAAPGAPDTMLTSQQLQLDIAALNLLCLARLQETAAVLAGRRPLPAHMNSSSTTYPLVSSSALNRRTHRCDEPGCDKVTAVKQL